MSADPQHADRRHPHPSDAVRLVTAGRRTAPRGVVVIAGLPALIRRTERSGLNKLQPLSKYLAQISRSGTASDEKKHQPFSNWQALRACAGRGHSAAARASAQSEEPSWLRHSGCCATARTAPAGVQSLTTRPWPQEGAAGSATRGTARVAALDDLASFSARCGPAGRCGRAGHWAWSGPDGTAPG